MDNLEIYWVFEFAIIPGRFEDLKTLMAAMVDATQKNEPGTLNYEWAISDIEVVKPARLVVYGSPPAHS